jgi:hypothetical protein
MEIFSRGRKVKLNEGGKLAIEGQLRKFKEKFGRDPLPKEPLFFDPDKDVPTPLSEKQVEEYSQKMLRMMLEAVPERPELAYAYKKTGLILTEMNMKVMPKADIEEFQAAAQEYLDLAAEGRAPKIL